MLEGPLSFHLETLSVCMYVCTDVGFSSTSKGKPSLSNENTMTNFFKTWYVGSGGISTTHVVYHHRKRIFNTSFAYLFWLARNKKVKYPEFCMDLGMWVVMGTSTTHDRLPQSLSSPNMHI